MRDSSRLDHRRVGFARPVFPVREHRDNRRPTCCTFQRYLAPQRRNPYAKSDVLPEGNCLIGATVLPWRFFLAWSHGRGDRTFSTRVMSSVDYNRERWTGKRRKTQPLKNHVAYWSEHNTKINTHLQQYFWINKTFYVLLLFAVKTNRLSWGAKWGIFGPR